ncbi:hypothetical protein CAEBREN_15252 [Caenorhabditis brenneri]|uniref:Serpentine receptor class r-10 n=1 Tax=Caenorhabditis brenneri TaxID=135651 RepID=G0M973_CAEBE|nr:hypothetical protein CAEBREN_15252 [Caenorhabditis brenneri]
MYKYLMVYISIFEAVYALLGLIVQPDFYSYSSVFLVIARTDRLGLPLWMIQIVNLMFCSMFGMSMATFTLHFIYRENFLPKHHFSIDEVTYVGPNYYIIEEDGAEILNIAVCVGMAIMIVMVTISILTIAIFACKCYKAIGVLLLESNHSEGYKTLQSQLLNMLIVQVTIPAILMHVPASILLTGPIFHIGNEIAGGLFCISVAIFPVIDPLPTMFMIQHYRKVLRAIVRKSLRICLLIQLILYRSPKGIGMYKYLMVYISGFELLYAFLGLLVQPDFYSYSSVFLAIARTNRLGLPLWMIQIVNLMFCSMFGMSMAMFTLHFIYRYCVIIGSSFVKMDSNFKICIWFLSPIVYGFVWGVILLSALGPNDSTNKLLKLSYFPKHKVTIEQVTYIGPNHYTLGVNGTESLNYTVLGGMSVIITMVSISILIIAIFAYKCYKGVGVLLLESNLSDGYKTLQSQLLNMLVVQVTIPVILMHNPASILFTGPIIHKGNEFAGGLFCIAVAVYPVLDPLPTMFMDFYNYSCVLLVVARTDRLGLPIWLVRVACTIFCCMFGMSMAMFTLHFIYRYCVISGSKLIKMDSTLKVCVWFLSPILYGFIWGATLYTTMGPNEYTDQILKDHYFQKHKINIRQITYLGPNYYKTDGNGTEYLNWTVFGGMTVLFTMVTISILIIIIFAYKCYKGVGVLLQESHHSEGFKTLQSQLLNMLVVQVTIPAVLMHGPSFILFTGAILHAGNEIAGGLFCIAVAVYPVLDPLPTMFMIQHYRKVLRVMVRRSLCLKV